jgi:hypothetical protein
VVVDILRELSIPDVGALVRARSFDRSELEFEVYQVPAAERLTFLAGKLRSVLDEFGWQPGQPGAVPSGLVFTYVTDDEIVGAETIAGDISGRLRLPVPVYTDVPPRGFQGDIPAWEEEKARVQRLFKRNDLPLLVCTADSAWGSTSRRSASPSTRCCRARLRSSTSERGRARRQPAAAAA